MIRRGSEVGAIGIRRDTRSEGECTPTVGCGVVNLEASRAQLSVQGAESEYTNCLCSSCTDFNIHGLEVGPQLSTQSSNEYRQATDTWRGQSLEL
jgi:hypothetical protein